MSFIAKPRVQNARLPKNSLGLTVRDYEGGMSTLCAGCGHDSITGAIVQAAFELGIEPHRMAKLSGIGCSSKTPAYFLRQPHAKRDAWADLLALQARLRKDPAP